ncbi:hypothetical protein LguiB_017776 [Lonicera macranthoides]
MGVIQFKFSLEILKNHSFVYGFNLCSYVFVAEERNYSFNSVDLWNLSGQSQFLLVVDWSVGTVACPDAERTYPALQVNHWTACLLTQPTYLDVVAIALRVFERILTPQE